MTLQMRRITGALVGRPSEVAAIEAELASARAGQLSAITIEGEPGIGKTRLVVAASQLAAENGFVCAAVTADEEIRGPFLLARGLLSSLVAHGGYGPSAEEESRKAIDAMSGRDDPSVEALSPDQKLLRVLDLGALAMRALATEKPLALLVDDLQWADIDSLRLLRYVVRSAADLPIFLVLALRPEEVALVPEAVTLLADMERMGMVRRLKLARFSQVETAEFLKQVLGGPAQAGSAATIHAQAEGVPFIVEELARTYRSAGMIQLIDGVWTLGQNVERLVPSAVRTLIERRAARLPDETKTALAEAAILGRTFRLKDLGAVKQHLGDDEDCCSPSVLAEELAPAVKTGLLIELPPGSPADYRFAHDHIRHSASAALTPGRRRSIHGAIVEMFSSEGEQEPESLSLVAQHALAAGDAESAARLSIEAARAALAARAPEEVLRIVELALTAAAAPLDRVELLLAQDQALEMLRRPEERLEGLAELAALAVALGDAHLELQIMLRRAAALRLSNDADAAVQLAREVRRLAEGRGDRTAELAACLELGQALFRTPLGESFVPTASEIDLDGAEEAYERARTLAEELGDLRSLAGATRELGVVLLGRIREWLVERVKRGEHVPFMQRIAEGEPLDEILAELPTAPLRHRAQAYYESAIELFEQLGDRRGVMSSIIAMAYLNFGTDIHFLGSAKRIEEIRRLSARMKSLTLQSEQGAAEAQMLYGAHVFARDKVVPDLALSRGEEAFQQARSIGDRLLEFAAAGGVAVVHIEMGEVDQAERWLDKAAAVAATSPTPLRARQLELWRGMARACAGDPVGMRSHLERAVQLATDQGWPSARCEALARLALEGAGLGTSMGDEDLIALAEQSANEAKRLMGVLPGRPPWRAQADAALAQIALHRGQLDLALEHARSASAGLQALEREEDPNLDALLPAARVLLHSPRADERQGIRDVLGMTLALIARRIIDEDVRVRWFRGPVGRELAELAGPLRAIEAGAEPTTEEAEPRDAVAVPESGGDGLSQDESRLLWLLIEGRTNREIAQELGVGEEVVRRRLAQLYGRIGVSSRGEATAIAFREHVV
ncbi:MAG: AAA family ATPase [Actinomycetota bacterium]|nr:AAA family ATPase [Actinomycetota bacterium]